MQRFGRLFPRKYANVIGMVHVKALPATPNSSLDVEEIIEFACKETAMYAETGVDAVLVENMHDLPYVMPGDLGPESVSVMTAVCREVRKVWPKNLPVGVQILAGANMEAMAVAKAANLQFVRAEGFVFSHVADEGIMSKAAAGPLLRYRRNIGADDIAVFCDIKKKHSAHAITADVDIAEVARAAAFFKSDGVIITGSATGCEASETELETVTASVKGLPVLIGSGVTLKNWRRYANANAFIVGSYFKKDGVWFHELDQEKILAFMKDIRTH
jgi:membrane complex biogenesis BtpA family protein